jgi:8-oxo-dGTP diphosphatase
MRVIETQNDVSWMPTPNRVRLVLDGEPPPLRLTTSVFVLAFDEQRRLLMTRLIRRGWDLPGGHIEPGESPEAALRREVLEETQCVLGDVRMLGYQHLSVLCAAPPNYRYPYPESYQVFFIARVFEPRAFAPTAEAAERNFFDVDEAKAVPWVQKNRLLYESAVASLGD